MPKNKRVSLITLQYINNYGSVLQTYASQLYLESKGCSVEVVNYTRENCRFDSLKKSMRAYYKSKGFLFNLPFVSDLLVMRWQRLHKKRSHVFDSFRVDKIKFSHEYHSLVELTDKPPMADFYCVGSDQVWNYLYNDGVLPEYFLQYAPKVSKKFSLSSSFGVEKIDKPEYAELTKKYLADFSLVTVREKSGKKILDSIGVSDSHQILDPTLLISGEEWISVLGLKNTDQDKYVLVYQLNPCKQMDDFARNIADELGCRLIIITNNIRMSVPNAEMISNPTVERFLELILNAEHIVTDSFHGTAFSINFNKEFSAWLPSNYSTRLLSVLELLDLRDRAYIRSDDRWKCAPSINYQRVNLSLLKLREEANCLIDEVLFLDEN